MAKQTFTTGQVLTAAEMTTLQANDYNQTVSAKVASYVLVAADAGTRITMSNAGATTITVNTSLFTAGDSVIITNIGAGASTITAGTATVSTISTLALSQYDSGVLYFTSTGVAIWQKYAGAAAGGGKVLQVVQGSTTTAVANATTTYADTGLTATITPTLNTSKVLVLIAHNGNLVSAGSMNMNVYRGGSLIINYIARGMGATGVVYPSIAMHYLDAPATTSATTYKTQFANNSGGSSVSVQVSNELSTIILMEIGA